MRNGLLAAKTTEGTEECAKSHSKGGETTLGDLIMYGVRE